MEFTVPSLHPNQTNDTTDLIMYEDSALHPIISRDESTITGLPTNPPIALGEALQCVRYARRGQTLMITGVTPHGRRLAFEQEEDHGGWYVVVAGRRRRPTERE